MLCKAVLTRVQFCSLFLSMSRGFVLYFFIWCTELTQPCLSSGSLFSHLGGIRGVKHTAITLTLTLYTKTLILYFNSNILFFLALTPSQSLLDQSESQGIGCRVSCLQYKQDGLKPLHDFLRIGATMLILFKSDTFVSMVLNLLVFMGLNLWFLSDHLVLILPVTCFLGFLGFLGGQKIGLDCHCSMTLSCSVSCHH